MKNENKKTVVLNSFQHPYLNQSSKAEEILEHRIKTLRGMVKGNAPVRNRRKGFTLIELLIVVLIIGILAAVAVPQYQLAVFKSRITLAITYVKAVHDAQEVYYLANGKYASSLADLDIQVTCPTKWTCGMFSWDVWVGNQENTFALVYFFNHGVVEESEERELNGVLYCWADTADTTATKICKNFGPETYGSSEARIRHRLN